MSTPVRDAEIRFQATRPELPPIEAWAPYMEEAYAANWFTNFGQLSRRLENGLRAQWGGEVSAFVLASSATAAIAAPLIARNITGPVVIPAFTFPATLSAVRMAGAQPVVVDVDRDDWRMRPETLQRALVQTGAKAAVIVSPFGMQSDFGEHIEVSGRQGATLIIDSAAGLGVARDQVERSEHVFEAYSLHATKPFGIGEGGAIVCNTRHEAAIRAALNFGLASVTAGELPNWGTNGKMSEVHAAIGLAVLARFEARLRLRRDFAARYAQVLSLQAGIELVPNTVNSVWQVFPILMPTESAACHLVDEARRLGMEVRRYYRPSLSQWPEVKMLGACPVAETLASRMCCLPVYSLMSDYEAEDMLDIAVRSVASAMEAI